VNTWRNIKMKNKNLCASCEFCRALNTCTIGKKFGNDNVRSCASYLMDGRSARKRLKEAEKVIEYFALKHWVRDCDPAREYLEKYKNDR